METPARTSRSVPLMLSDTLALLAFVLVGNARHTTGFTIAEIGKTFVPLLAAWFFLAWVFGAYRRAGWWTLGLTWITAIPLGAVLRSLVRGGPWDADLFVFAGVALVFSLLFLVAGRLVLRLLGFPRGSARA